MKKNELTFSEFDKNITNPFITKALDEMESHVTKKYRCATGTDKAIITMADVETGEVVKTSFLKQVEVDEQQFAKLYLSNLSSFFDLSTSAIRVFTYILTQLKPKSDMVMFLIDGCKQFTKFSSKVTIYKALAELCRAEIIARGPLEGVIFINPLVVFNGDRVAFTKEYIKRKNAINEQKK